jgi:hypothetical protein
MIIAEEFAIHGTKNFFLSLLEFTFSGMAFFE